MTDYLTATYQIESFLTLDRAAEAIAGEQTTGTFIDVPSETEEIRDRYRAVVRSVTELSAQPTAGECWLPGALRPKGSQLRRGQVVIDFPVDNVGHSFSNVTTAVAGNLFELRELAGIRLVDLVFPRSFVEAHPGPSKGGVGTRQALGGTTGPLIGTIIKPSVGLSPVELVGLVTELAAAKVDFIKDDELMNDPPYSPFATRVQAVLEALATEQDRTGHRVMYAFNVTGDTDDMLQRFEAIERAGGTCAMVVASAVGISTLEMLRRSTDLVLHVHRAGFGALSRHPNLGISFRAFQKLVRMAGADHLHTNGFANKFYEDDDQIEQSVRAVLEPIGTRVDTLPVLSSGQSAATVEETWRRLHTEDLLMLAGGGILGHKGGPAAGVESIREAWNAVTSGSTVQDASRHSPALKAALSQFGTGS